MAQDTGHTVIGFDYAGTGLKRITTWSSQALVNDSYHLALQALQMMDKHHALILKGNLLGGAIATKVAKRCHDAEIKAYLWNGRSFKSASLVVAGLIETLHISGHYTHAITKNLSTIALFCRNDIEVSANDLFKFFSKIYVEKHRQEEENIKNLLL